jgi:hypothetical protein
MTDYAIFESGRMRVLIAAFARLQTDTLQEVHPNFSYSNAFF